MRRFRLCAPLSALPLITFCHPLHIVGVHVCILVCVICVCVSYSAVGQCTPRMCDCASVVPITRRAACFISVAAQQLCLASLQSITLAVATYTMSGVNQHFVGSVLQITSTFAVASTAQTIDLDANSGIQLQAGATFELSMLII